MEVFNKLIKVSKASFLNKVFKIDESKIAELSKEEREALEKLLPTEEEKLFAEVYRSNIPQLVRLQRKMSVCLDVEVLELEEDKISFQYGENTFTLISPTNAFRICSALEKGKLEGLSEMVLQGCVSKGEKIIHNLKEESGLAVDEMRTLLNVADKFFFQTFLV